MDVLVPLCLVPVDGSGITIASFYYSNNSLLWKGSRSANSLFCDAQSILQFLSIVPISSDPVNCCLPLIDGRQLIPHLSRFIQLPSRENGGEQKGVCQNESQTNDSS